MRNRKHFTGLGVLLIIIYIVSGCTKDVYLPGANNLLKKIKNGDYIVEEISYNQNNLVSEVNSTLFYRKFHYDQDLRLIKEEVAISPDSYSSSIIPGATHDFVDPEKTGISMIHLYEYDNKGNLTRQLNYIPKNGKDELRSKRTFEYNDNNLISKELLYNSDNEVTQFWSYKYDSNGNVTEEDYYTYLFITSGTGPKHLSKATFEYDSFFNPYKIFERSGHPGISTNLNNIIKTKTVNYDHVPGMDANSESTTSYEYNYETGYPKRVVNGEEFIYE
jgi:YD repeat-containing protein